MLKTRNALNPCGKCDNKSDINESHPEIKQHAKNYSLIKEKIKCYFAISATGGVLQKTFSKFSQYSQGKNCWSLF